MTTPEGEPGDRTPPTLSPPSPILPLLRRIALTLLWLVLLTLLARQVAHAPADVLDRLGKARPGLIAAGVVIYALGFAARAARLNLLLPPADRIPFGRAWAVSGATTFLLSLIHISEPTRPY